MSIEAAVLLGIAIYAAGFGTGCLWCGVRP
jgi:hypothetical protein